METTNRQKVKDYIKKSRIKAGHSYKDKETGVSYRILGIGLEPITLIPRVIYSEVNDLTGQNLLIDNLILLEGKLA